MSRRPEASRVRLSLAAMVLALAPAGCLPYTVGSTAQTVPPGERRLAASTYVVPNAVDLVDHAVRANMRGTDVELRWGVSDDVDVGLRATSFNGAVVTVKKRVLGDADSRAAALSYQLGGGLVNFGDHAEVELSLLGSTRRYGWFTPYGGARTMAVRPIGHGGVHDGPTVGGLLGVRIGGDTLAIMPELGVYRDPSALGLRHSRVVFVPAITISAGLLSRVLGRR